METAARETGRRLILPHQFLILQRHPRREQLRAALSELLFHLRVRRSQHFARDGGGGSICSGLRRAIQLTVSSTIRPTQSASLCSRSARSLDLQSRCSESVGFGDLTRPNTIPSGADFDRCRVVAVLLASVVQDIPTPI
jgi:hypothetical protein